MNIKERIKTIIEDYSFAKDEVQCKKQYQKNLQKFCTTEDLWDYVKDPILLKVKRLISYTNSLITKLGDKWIPIQYTTFKWY